VALDVRVGRLGGGHSHWSAIEAQTRRRDSGLRAQEGTPGPRLWLWLWVVPGFAKTRLRPAGETGSMAGCVGASSSGCDGEDCRDSRRCDEERMRRGIFVRQAVGDSVGCVGEIAGIRREGAGGG
ncbi:hypothetical protein V490_03921, partial [Pseudogymnoascus sp. VKM F-3557]